MTTPTPYQNARAAVQGMLNGGAPPSEPGELGDWRQLVDQLAGAYRDGHTAAVRAAYHAAARADRRVASLIAGRAELAEPATAGCPPLPAAATAIYQHAAPCGHWLDEYIAYAAQAAPMTPRPFHEAAGLFAAALAVARRLCLPVGGSGRIYPNIYAIFIAPSTIYHKSTGLKVLESVLQAAGLGHLLLPRKGTPEALVADLDPYKLPTSKVHDMELFLARRAFAAQRGYLRDEVSSLFASLRREFNAGLLELILDLYDSPAFYDEVTISRGEVVIRDACLSFFGASTPIEMGPHLADTALWSNGLWARFALIVPDGVPDYDFHRREVNGLPALAQGLRGLYRLLPAPIARLVKAQDDADDPRERDDHIVIDGAYDPAPVALETGVWEAWEAYSRATGFTLLTTGDIDQELYGNYGRLGTKLIKVAMLLAAMDADEHPVTVTLAHLARAQRIVEGWREQLHKVWNQNAETAESRLSKRIAERLRKAGGAGLTCHALTRMLRSGAKETREALDTLAKAGQVICTESHAPNGRKVENWTWSSQD